MSERDRAWTAGPWHAGRSDMLSYDASGTVAFKNIYADDPRGGWHKPTNSALPLTVAKAVDESALFAESGGEPIPVDELMANAALIAAAPDLYDALEALLTIIESEFQVERDERTDGSHIAASVRGDWVQARAALARARGEAL